jgi:hypothetical protein
VLLVRVNPFAYFWRKQIAIFLNGEPYEEKKRDPRLLEEKERAAAAFHTGPYEAPAAGIPTTTAGESGKATRHFDEVGAQGIVVTSRRVTFCAAAIVDKDPVVL